MKKELEQLKLELSTKKERKASDKKVKTAATVDSEDEAPPAPKPKSPPVKIEPPKKKPLTARQKMLLMKGL